MVPDKSHLAGLHYRHADVFTNEPLSGNGLTVFFDVHQLSAEMMQRLTQEMRQFESIFLTATAKRDTFKARIFTAEEELDFAGHPVLGAAACLHEKYAVTGVQTWTLELKAKPVSVTTVKQDGFYQSTMDQGTPTFLPPLEPEAEEPLLAALNLRREDRARPYPLQVVSTGLPYLIVPVETGLSRSGIQHADFEALLAALGAKFVYVLDVKQREGRTWDNAGRVEDVATGSAAGPVGAFLHLHGGLGLGAELILKQGQFVGRPSEMRVRLEGKGDSRNVLVTGDVCLLAHGVFD